MTQPIIQGKLTAPPPPAGYLPRPRLESRWDDWRERRLVLVTAGAGSGKTSLLSVVTAICSRPVFWYTLDEMDADPAVLRDYLLYAVSAGKQRATSDVDHDLAEIVRCLRGLDQGSVVILDDLQLAAGSPEAFAFLERLARYLPVGHTLILSSREPLDLATMKLRTQGVVAELRAKDLAFSSDEVAALFGARFDGATMDNDLAAVVVDCTEGWAAGIEILLQSLESSDPQDVRQALEHLREAGSGWFAYFAEEVVCQLPAQMRDFLRRSALLPRLDSGLCDAALGVKRSGHLLADLNRRNLFTARMERPRREYRYHRLFRDFLIEMQAREGSPQENLRIHRRAARVLEQRGEWDDAILAYAEGGAVGAAVNLLEKRSEELLASGRQETICRALDLLPESAFARRPVALLALGKVQEGRGELRRAVATFRRALPLATSGRRRRELMCLVAQVKLRQSEFRACINLCRKALREPGRVDVAIRGRLLEMIGVSMCDLGRLDEGEAHLQEAREVFGRSLSEEEEARLFYLLQSNIHYRRGNFRHAKDAARRALRVFRRRGDLRSICHSLGVLAHISADACQVGEARDLAHEGLRLAGSLDYQLMQGYCRHALGRCSLAVGDCESAGEHFEAALLNGEQVGESGLLVLPLLGLAEAAARAGNRHAARRLAQDALTASVDRKLIYQEAQARYLLGLVVGSAHRSHEFFNEAEAIMRRIGMRYDLHRLLLDRLDAGDVSHSDTHVKLKELFEGVAELGHDFLFQTLERECALGVLQLGLQHEVTAAEAARQLAEMGGAGGGEILTNSPTEPLHIQALGSLEVSAAGRVLKFDDWRSRRALRLFQYLLVRRFRWVPRDEIIEALWPETDPAKGLNSLRQTVYVLRNTLAGSDGVGENTDRFICYRNEALRLDPGEGYVYDVETCEEHLHQAEFFWTKGDGDAAAGSVLAAERSYGNHFLAESPYEEFTVEARQLLRERLLRNVARLCAWYARRRKWEQLVPLARRAVGLDSYHEEFHQRLVEGLSGLGHRAEAVQSYHQFETLMIRDLDLLPSNEFKALAEKLSTIS